MEECIGIVRTRLDNRRGNSGGHGVSECRSDVSERPGMEMDDKDNISVVNCHRKHVNIAQATL